MFDFDAFKPATVTVTIKTPYGREQALALQLLSYWRWNEVGEQVASPVPRKKIVGDSQTEYDYSDPEFLRKRAEAEQERALRRLADALEGGGNPLPGDDLEEKAAALRAWETGIVTALNTFLLNATFKTEAAIEAKVAAFQPAPAGEVAAAAADGLDAGAVAGAGG